MSELLQVVGDDIEVLEKLVNRDKYLKVVNQKPPTSWVKKHPVASGVTYLPIDKIEILLTTIFQEWYIEVLREGQLANSVYTAIRLYFRDPITGNFLHQDGVGAAPIQTDKGKSASDLAAIKSDAIMKALPAAESFAVKDAAEKIGKIFGKDLNRKDVIDFTPNYEDGANKKLEDKRKKVKEGLVNENN